jgi:hypothetical protein
MTVSNRLNKVEKLTLAILVSIISMYNRFSHYGSAQFSFETNKPALAAIPLSSLRNRTESLVGPSSNRTGRASSSLKSSVNLNVVKLSAKLTEAQVMAAGAARVSIGKQTLYIGTQQVTASNQNPIVLAFEGGKLRWANTKYETTGADGRGMGLFYNGKNLYGVFSVDGTQGKPTQDFRRVSGGAMQAWLRSYGNGGGAKVSVVAKLDPRNGNLQSAVYLSALNNGKTNSLQVKQLGMSGSNLWVNANSYFAPRNINGTAMQQIGTAKSPFNYTIELSPDLKKALKASATGWRSSR